MAFHETRFPIEIALGSRGGPERRTEIVEMGSGREERNCRWAHSRRRYDAGYGVKSAAALAQIVQFFEERRGRLHGFRYRDPLDDRSCTPGQTPQNTDQLLATGDGVQAAFQLYKTYGASSNAYVRPIAKPVAGTVLISVGGVAKTVGTQVNIDAATGIITFVPGHIPANGAVVRAGFKFDVPVRFDTDRLEIDLSAFAAGEIPNIPLIEILV
jgi:uncharacterized protein (TIGR02217 family)